MRRPLSVVSFKDFHVKVSVAHPVFDGAEAAFDRCSSQRYFLWLFIERLLNDFQNLLMFPPRNPAFFF